MESLISIDGLRAVVAAALAALTLAALALNSAPAPEPRPARAHRRPPGRRTR